MSFRQVILRRSCFHGGYVPVLSMFITNDRFILQRILLAFLLMFQTSYLMAEGLNEARFWHNTRTLNLLPFIDILPDPSQSLVIEDVITGELAGSFSPASVVGNTFGFSKAAYWVRFSLGMEQSLNNTILLQLDSPLTDIVELYIPDELGGFDRKVTGETLPFTQREVVYRSFLFHLPHHEGEIRTYYMRLQTEGSLQVPLSLWTQHAFIEHVDTTNIVLGVYFGIMLLLALVALAAFQKMRDKLFLAYALYLSSYLLLQLSLIGFGFQYLWPELPEWSNRVTAASVGLAVLFGLLFSGMFLQVFGDKHTHVKAVFLFGMVCSASSVLMSLLGNFALAAKYATILGILLPPVVLFGAISALITGYKPARYFLIAWCIFLCGVFVAGLLFLGLAPYTFATFYAMQIGSTFEVLLLGYALMDRIELLRIEKDRAKLQANQCLLQLNEELEFLVNERTQKLKKINNELREMATHDSKTGLLNHSAALDFLKLMQTSVLRYGGGLAVVMIDIDHFKLVNDTYGHPAGDQVIADIAGVLKASIRESDVCGRYGGEEFILILPRSDPSSAIQLAERVRTNIQQLRILEIDHSPVTVSLGIAMLEPSELSESVVLRADKALYEAKEAGRNRVVLSDATFADTSR